MRRVEDGGEPAARRTSELEEHVRQLRRRAALLDQLLERLQRTEVWDHTVYEQTPGSEWVAVNRRDLEQLFAVAASAARWDPWRSIIERRPGDP